MKGEDTEHATGYGISTWEHSDLEHPVIVVDTDKQEVRVVPTSRGREDFPEVDDREPLWRGSFTDFCEGKAAAVYDPPEED